MSKLYTGIEIGTNSIKIVVAQKIRDTFKILAAKEKKSEGIRKEEIVDAKKVSNSICECLQEVEKMLGMKIKKVITCISSKDCLFNIVSSKIKTIDENCITGGDVTSLIRNALKEKKEEYNEVITATPIGYKLDDGKVVKNPLGLRSTTLESRIVTSSVPRKSLYPLLNVLELCGLEIVEITFKSVGDYFEVRNKKIDNEVGAIINIGEDTTSVSIYNKGIMIKSSSLKVGSYYVDHDFSYIYKIGLKEARKLKETFAAASTRYADQYDEIEITTEALEQQTINQLDATKIVEARITEILKIAKKEIKNLTNRKISYIIILGGLSEMTGFQYIAESILGQTATVWNSTTIGARHNKYTSVLGIIKYFDDKLELREKEYEMFSAEDMNKLISINKKEEHATINTMFEQFLDN